MRILVIEDEKKTAAFLAKGLREAGFAVDVAIDGETGLKQARTTKFDLLIVDIMLPFPCTSPAVDAVGYFQQGPPFDFTIAPGPGPNVCRLSISSINGGPFTSIPHLLVTVALAPPRRTGFVIGLIASGGSCPSPGVPIERSYTPNIGTCPMMQL